MLVHVGQLTSEEEMERVLCALWGDNHVPFGGAPRLAEGSEATLLWWPETDAAELLRVKPRPVVLHRGVRVGWPAPAGAG
jgi:hypothetical protein